MSPHYHSNIKLENSKNKRNRLKQDHHTTNNPKSSCAEIFNFEIFLYIPIQPFWILEVLQPHTMT